MLVIGTRKMLHKLPENFHVTLLEKKITPATSVQDLGIQLDLLLSFDGYIVARYIDVTASTCIASLCQITGSNRSLIRSVYNFTKYFMVICKLELSQFHRQGKVPE